MKKRAQKRIAERIADLCYTALNEDFLDNFETKALRAAYFRKRILKIVEEETYGEA